MLIERIKSLFRRNGNTQATTLRPTGSHEDFLVQETPELGKVVFSPLLPIVPFGAISSFDELTEPWLRDTLGDAIYDLGAWTCEQKLVISIERRGFYLHGEVASSKPESQEIYLTEMAVMDGDLQGVCSCSRTFEQVMTHGVLPTLGAHLPPCKHIAAVLISYMREQMQPTLERVISTCVCPVTRQSLIPGSQIYMCQNCGTAYSPEGWEFLQEVDKGRCCNCRAENTIHSFVLPA